MPREKHLTLENTGFRIKEARYNYSDVEMISFYREQVQKTLNFVASGIDHSAQLKIYVRDITKPLIVESGPRLFRYGALNFGKGTTEILTAKFEELGKITFAQRMEKYLHALEQQDYFFYDGNKIFRSGQVEGPGWSFNLTAHKPILKIPFAIYFEEKTNGFLRKKKRYVISTLTDPDVFFTILGRLFGLRW